ncbi:endothelin-converting enzyme Metallo peptidase. MEROPS family M13 [Granulicella rosea]|uniref:Endothelin-converting enzyme Metallo peptidase. MEROPS family M13 n=1 Tax=Granulicella rosea TaxID=474952 RepID=A0A239L6R2_9BACT|nr:M13 family metallopeptidase [Granulicella rosea]SNT26015.1 endothelin-converting enzyme Metallo peptidase. MEROPS family M13 [Granulicella rosea]
MRLSSVGAFFLSAAMASAAAGQVGSPSDLPTEIPTKPISFDLSAIDKTVDPCNDFYKFACGNWLKNNPIPDTKVRWGAFDELAQRNVYLLYQDLQAAATAPKTPLQKKYGDYFAACMDTKLADTLGAKPIAPNLEAIAALKDKDDLATFDVAMLHRFGHAMVFGVAVTQDQKDSTKQILATGQGVLSLPDRDYYLNDDDRSKKIREQYVAHVEKMFTLLGDSPEKAAAEAADVLRIETALAKAQMSRVEMRDPDKRYHILAVAELQALSPNYDWKKLLAGEGVASVATVDVTSPQYVSGMSAVLKAENLNALKSYFRWRELHGAAAQLSEPFVKENFDFFAAILNGQKQQTPRWQRCTRATDAALGEAVGQDWVKQNFPPDAKANMEKLVAALERSLDEDLKTLPWMGPETRAEAKAKLDAIRQKIGYPESWRDYSTLLVRRDDVIGNAERTAAFDHKRNMAKLGKAPDEKEWSMTPPTVNAYYNPSQNDINFPAGILQPPFFDNKLDPAVNFGAIGAVIGHEMTHGFDDQGAKFDGKGNRRDWFTKDDLANFNERTSCIADEYSGFEAAPGQKLNGRLTLGENTADNGGIRIAYQALLATLADKGGIDAAPKVDGYTAQQRFFIGFGQVWCENQREAAARVQAKTDPHSTAEWRVRGTVQNFDQFGKAFGCKVGQPMMPEKSCRVW